MDAKEEHPEWRTGFRHPDLKEFVTLQRVELIRAVITLVRAWQAAGRPQGQQTLGMFESWAKVMGGILLVAEQPGFLRDDRRQPSNVIAMPWVRFFGRWWTVFGDQPVGVATVFPLLRSQTDGPIDLGFPRDADDDAQRVALGKRLRQKRDVAIGGFYVRDGGTRQGARQWRLERAPEVPTSEPIPDDRAA
jgi:DNA polymerase-1